MELEGLERLSDKSLIVNIAMAKVLLESIAEFSSQEELRNFCSNVFNELAPAIDQTKLSLELAQGINILSCAIDSNMNVEKMYKRQSQVLDILVKELEKRYAPPQAN